MKVRKVKAVIIYFFCATKAKFKISFETPGVVVVNALIITLGLSKSSLEYFCLKSINFNTARYKKNLNYSHMSLLLKQV